MVDQNSIKNHQKYQRSSKFHQQSIKNHQKPSNTKTIDLYKIAKSSNYKAFKTNSKTGLRNILRGIKNIDGPIMILIKITKGGKIGKRIIHSPVTIKKRFIHNL